MRIGLIGCGGLAIEHVSSLRGCPDIEIVLADIGQNLARAFGEKEGLDWAESPVEMFADPTIAAVDLCVPIAARAPLIRRALAAEKDFICEDALCETAAEARELRDLAESNGRIAMTGCRHRHAPAFQKARSALADARETGISPAIGKLTIAMMRIGGRPSAEALQHCRGADRGGLIEMLAHLLDLAVWYFGPIEHAKLMLREALRPRRMLDGDLASRDAQDFAIVRCRTRTGLPIVMQADLLAPCFSQMVEVQGDNGAIMVSAQADMPQFVFAVSGANGYRAGRTDLSRGRGDFCSAQMAAFVAAARDRRPDQQNGLADSVHVAEAIEMLMD
ncbi:MAG TPA: Gfo/Idh/MocA family oxidoreductase [Stellaceae bacterium]|nr:Gfo/Idh/MocA family oxidoreductase [Stellaceae bacterium]